MTAVTARPRRWLSACLSLFCVLRLPSFLEPRWYSDESTYSYVGRSIISGGDLYRSAGAWDNKPPLQYWAYGIVTHFLGYSEAAIHLLPFLCGIASVCAVAWGVLQLTASQQRAAAAALAATIIIGLPIFDGDLFLPESVLIGPMTWAGMLFVVHTLSPERAARHRWWPWVAGALAAVALGFQQTVIADIAGLSIIFVLHCPERWRELARFWAAGIVVTALWLLPTLVASGWNATMFAIVFFYLTYAHNALGAGVVSRLLHFVGLVVGAVAGVAGAVMVARRSKGAVWMLWMLSGVELLTAGAAHYHYPHLLMPSMPWLVAAAACTPWAQWRSLVPRITMGRRGIGSLVLIGGLCFAVAEGSYAGVDWVKGYPNLGRYYGIYPGLASTATRTAWQDSFSGNVATDQTTATWLVGHHYGDTSAVVWNTSDEWLYLLADLHTTIPTVGLYNNDILLGGAGRIGAYVVAHRPEIIITDTKSLSHRRSIIPVLVRYYIEIYRDGPTTVYLERRPRIAHRTEVVRV